MGSKYRSAGRLPFGSQVSIAYHFDLPRRTPFATSWHSPQGDTRRYGIGFLPLRSFWAKRRILVRGAYEAIGIKYRSAGRLPLGSQVSIAYHFDLPRRTPFATSWHSPQGDTRRYGIGFLPHSHSERSEESWYAVHMRQSAVNTGRRLPLSRFAGLLHGKASHVIFRSLSFPYKSRSLATPVRVAE